MFKSVSKSNLLLLLLFLLDRLIKYLVIHLLPLKGAFVLPYLKIKATLNPHLALSLPLANYLAAILSLIITVILIYYLIKSVKISLPLYFSLGLVIIGAISNLLDRFKFAGVIDYLDLWRLPTFNLSDLYIIIGLLLLTLSLRKLGKL